LLHPLPRVKTKKFSTLSNEVMASTLMNEVAACFTNFQGEKPKNAPLLSKEENTNPSNYMFNNLI
jgi:hypothetical protein